MNLIRMYRRWWLKREIHFWGERVELLDRRRRTWEADMQHALDECTKAKRALGALDIPPARVTYAPGHAPIDGVARFTLMQDRPVRTPIARKRQLAEANEAANRG